MEDLESRVPSGLGTQGKDGGFVSPSLAAYRESLQDFMDGFLLPS